MECKSGKMTGEKALKSIGLEVQGLIQDSIKNGNWEKNASSTIKAKKFTFHYGLD